MRLLVAVQLWDSVILAVQDCDRVVDDDGDTLPDSEVEPVAVADGDTLYPEDHDGDID